MNRFDQQEKQSKIIAESLAAANKLLMELVKKDQIQDERIWQLEKKVSGDD